MNDPTLLFVLNDAASFATFRLPAARAAEAEGFQVAVAAPPGAGAADIEARGYPFHPIRLSRRSMNPLKEPFSVSSLVSLYRRLRPELVHHVTIKPVIYGSLAARATRVPAVVNAVTGLGWVFAGNGDGRGLVRWGVEKGYRAAFNHPNQRALFQNPDDRDHFLARGLLDGERARVIRGSGVDTEALQSLAEPAGEPVAILPARLLWDKGVAEFVEAARALMKKGVAMRLALVGDTDPGNPAAVPRERIEEWQRSGLVEAWGWQTDMQAAYAKAHVVCLPSYREGVPKALLEAAAHGRPLVATDVPGCREIVRDGETGLLVPPKDSERLADALERLARDERLRQRLGAGARGVAVAEFDERIVTDQTRALYRELAAASRV